MFIPGCAKYWCKWGTSISLIQLETQTFQCQLETHCISCENYD